jgi:hypothetical protein
VYATFPVAAEQLKKQSKDGGPFEKCNQDMLGPEKSNHIEIIYWRLSALFGHFSKASKWCLRGQK